MNEPLRQRQPYVADKPFLAWIRQQRCSVPGCVTGPIEAAHVRYGNQAQGKRSTGMQERPSDRGGTVPLCSYHHREGPRAQHGAGERAWWEALGLDPVAIAQDLAREYEYLQRGP